MSLRTDARAAALQLVHDCAAQMTPPVNVATYPGRPASIAAPHAFVDRITEGISYTGPESFQRSPSVDVVLLHGLFDSKAAVDQADAFVEELLVYVAERPHAAGANTTIAITSIEDDPTFVPDWIRGEQKTYYATRMSFDAYEGD